MSKKNIIKDLKRMGLIPTKKQQDQMWMLVGILVLLTMTGLAMYGAWKYPVPYHYYENMNLTSVKRIFWTEGQCIFP